MRRAWKILGLACLALAGSGRAVRPPGLPRPLAEIARLVANRSESEVEKILGPPGARTPPLADEEVCIWWSATYLEGEQYPPELLGMPLHLEITFTKPAGAPGGAFPRSAWRVAGPFAVNSSQRVETASR
jgi:hypothetical protein